MLEQFIRFLQTYIPSVRKLSNKNIAQLRIIIIICFSIIIFFVTREIV